MDEREREIWTRFVGPDPDSDELYGMVCPECGEPIPPGEEKWLMRVAFCEDCLPAMKRKIESPPEPSDALKRLRKHLHALR